MFVLSLSNVDSLDGETSTIYGHRVSKDFGFLDHLGKSRFGEVIKVRETQCLIYAMNFFPTLNSFLNVWFK